MQHSINSNMDVSLKASEKLATEDNYYPCRARTTRVAHALIPVTMGINKCKNINLKLNLTLLRT